MADRGPLPQWHLVDEETGVFESTGDDGTRWRLWQVAAPSPDDPFPAGWRLAPSDDLTNTNYIAGVGNMYFAMDLAGMRIAGDAVHTDPEGAKRQLGFDGDQEG